VFSRFLSKTYRSGHANFADTSNLDKNWRMSAINADDVIEEIVSGQLRPRSHSVARALHQFLQIEDAMQREALTAIDRGAGPAEWRRFSGGYGARSISLNLLSKVAFDYQFASSGPTRRWIGNLLSTSFSGRANRDYPSRISLMRYMHYNDG